VTEEEAAATETPAAMQDASRDEGRQYALPLVIRVERTAPPARTDALEGAARAVLRFLTDPRVTEADGEWAAAARTWEDARIRKVVRRARGAAWERATALPGITVAHRSAEIRVYPPVPVNEWPADLARLQVSGTDLDDPRAPEAPAAETPVLWLNPGLPMTAGSRRAGRGQGAVGGTAGERAAGRHRRRLHRGGARVGDGGGGPSGAARGPAVIRFIPFFARFLGRHTVFALCRP
jgi:hypothetical protein